MTQAIDLRGKFRRGSLIGGIGGTLSLLGGMGTVVVWAMFGPTGLAAEFVFFDIVVFLAVFGQQQQIDSLLLALRGVPDTSDLSNLVRRGMDPTQELQHLRSLLDSLQGQIATLSGQRQEKQV